MTPTDARDDLVERDAKPTPDKRDEALRLALPLLELGRKRINFRDCIGEDE